jgi:low affinity Fe/Cu permease
MAINPHSFFNFAAQNYSLLHDIFRRSGGMNDAELAELIRRHRTSLESPTALIEKLVNLKIIEPLPDASASYEMTRTVAILFRFLLQEQRLTSTAVIQAYLDELERAQADLEHAMADEKHSLIERALDEISETAERIRQDSRANREAIINEVMSVKSNREKRTVSERFEKILHLWKHYLEPLKDLIDVRKTMDASLDSLERILKQGEERFLLDGALHREFSRCSVRLVRLRRDLTTDFHESMHEVEPLYASLKQDSTLARGVARALERIGKAGIKSLNLPGELAIPSGWLREGLFDNTDVEAFLHNVRGYQPQEPPMITLGTATAPPGFIPPDELFDRLAQALPVIDVLQWLLDLYQEYPFPELLRAYGRIFTSDAFKSGFSRVEKSYQVPGMTVLARPLTVEAPL